MDFKGIPFSHLSFDPLLVQVSPKDFESLVKQDTFFFDESEEALFLLSDEDRTALIEFEKAFS